MHGTTYWVLYVILLLEDFALLTGALALVVALSGLMYFTRSLSKPTPTVDAS